MTTFLAGVDSEETAEHLLAYLRGRIDDDDTVYAVNSQRGGDDTSDDEVAAGKSALEPLEEELGADGHQLVRGNSPQEDMIQFARDHDVDTDDTFRLGVREERVELHVRSATSPAGVEAFHDRLTGRVGALDERREQ